MEILCFKISGKLAHFRKYYANNTAFSFTIPPRTSLMGIVAAAMGWQRDSYYEKLASENIRFGVRVLTPLKKSFHRLNFLSIKSLGDMAKKWSSDFRGEGGRIQTPFEIVSGWNLPRDMVSYQIFISPTETGRDTFEEIKKQMLENQPVFNITLGIANFSATISDIQLIEDSYIAEEKTREFILMHSAIPSRNVEKLEFKKDDFDSYNFVEEDMMPADFLANNNREVRKMNRLLFSVTPNPLRVILKTSLYKIQLPDEKINIQFMDE
jgi:CRISPR-associated protein Cas5h